MSSVAPNSFRAWLLAARPKTLTAACAPVIIAAALASRVVPLRLTTAVLCLLFAGFMQIASNFINDLYDFLRGTDGSDRLGPERACAQGWITPRAMRRGIALVIALACTAGLLLLASAEHRLALVLLGASCVVFAFLYTTYLSYRALGDVLVVVFFGFVPVLGTYFVLTDGLSTAAWWLGAACGLVTDTLLVVNNYRDRDTDRAAGKVTLIALLGERGGSALYLLLGVVGVICAAVGGCCAVGHGTAAIYVITIYLLLHAVAYRRMRQIRCGRALNAILAITARNILIFSLLTTLALILA